MGKKNKNGERKSSGMSFTSLADLASLTGKKQETEKQTEKKQLSSNKRDFNGMNVQMGKSNQGKINKGGTFGSTQMFINPYTFVPISKKVPDRNYLENKGNNVSGMITCSLEVKSPVFIPNTGKKFRYFPKEKEHYFSEFFSYEDLAGKDNKIPEEPPKYPRIPGSELRGVIRNLYEQLTNSCFSVIDEENIPSKRTSSVKKAGILDMETYDLYEGERILLNTTGRGKGIKVKIGTGTNEYRSGDKVYIRVERDKGRFFVGEIRKAGENGRCLSGWKEGYVLIGESFSKKNNDSVIVKKEAKAIHRLDEKDIGRFEKLLEKYSLEKHKKYESKYYELKKQKEGYLPVFYSTVGTGNGLIYYLSSAMITREVFSNTISDILKQNYQHQCCDGSNGWCPACRLFGMIGKSGKETKALASRLRFSDSEVLREVEFAKPRILGILGTPSHSSTEFYLQRPNSADIWNYDYYISNKKNTVYQPDLRGRKVYWLGKDRSSESGLTDSVEHALQNPDQAAHLKQRSAVRALKKGKTEFKVFFEDITEDELKNLLFCLNLGELGKEETEPAYHRIGKGKPFGMGAVDIKVQSVQLKTYKIVGNQILSENKEVDLSEYNQDSELYQETKGYILNYSKMLDKNEASLVEYPSVVGAEEIFKWFGKNRGAINRESIIQVLPQIKSDDKKLRKYNFGK